MRTFRSSRAAARGSNLRVRLLFMCSHSVQAAAARVVGVLAAVMVAVAEAGMEVHTLHDGWRHQLLQELSL